VSNLVHLGPLWRKQRTHSSSSKLAKIMRPNGSDHDSRSATLLVMASAVAGLTVTMGAKPTPRYVWNASHSVPIGFYRVDRADKLALGNLVVVMPPEPLASFLANGGYLPLGIPLIKSILALPGQSVCRNESLISVDGHEIGTALERDHHGRPLPNWQGCRCVAQDEVFLMNRDEPASLDGRYFGPLPASTIIGRAEPVWTIHEK
jgi:conjugative transfer signal peptidase TraF